MITGKDNLVKLLPYPIKPALAIPMPDLAVPIADPKADKATEKNYPKYASKEAEIGHLSKL